MEDFLNFLSCKYYSYIVAQKVGDNLSPRTRRPKSDNPKGSGLKACIDTETDRRIQEYCKRRNKIRTQVVREGIELVLVQEK